MRTLPLARTRSQHDRSQPSAEADDLHVRWQRAAAAAPKESGFMAAKDEDNMDHPHAHGHRINMRVKRSNIPPGWQA
jgi:hypothetical protein